MSRAWCVANRATRPQNFTEKEDMITAHEANGTGPYMLKARQPDIKTVLAKNPNWWGIKSGLWEGNADEVIYLPIVSDATRVAALMSGEVDLVNDPPPQDVPRLKQNSGVKVLEGSENRIVFIGMDQKRDELLYSNVKGKNHSGQARAAGLVSGDRHRPSDDDDASVAAVGMPSPCSRRRSSKSACRSTRRRPSSFRPKPATRTASEVTRLSEQPLRQRPEDLPGAAMGADRRHDQNIQRMPRAGYFPKPEKTDTACTCWAGDVVRPMAFHPAAGAFDLQRQGRWHYNYGGYTNPRLDELIAKVKVD
jgi:peptide/nickel transport system substrate-binding protein